MLHHCLEKHVNSLTPFMAMDTQACSAIYKQVHIIIIMVFSQSCAICNYIFNQLIFYACIWKSYDHMQYFRFHYKVTHHVKSKFTLVKM